MIYSWIIRDVNTYQTLHEGRLPEDADWLAAEAAVHLQVKRMAIRQWVTPEALDEWDIVQDANKRVLYWKQSVMFPGRMDPFGVELRIYRNNRADDDGWWIANTEYMELVS